MNLCAYQLQALPSKKSLCVMKYLQGRQNGMLSFCSLPPTPYMYTHHIPGRKCLSSVMRTTLYIGQSNKKIFLTGVYPKLILILMRVYHASQVSSD